MATLSHATNVTRRRSDSPLAALMLFSITLLGLGGSIVGLGVLSLQRPAAAFLPLPESSGVRPAAQAGPADMTPADAVPAGLSTARLSEEVLPGAPVEELPWTMSLLPEAEGAGRSYTFSGTMVLPEGLEAGQQVNLTVYYTETTLPAGADAFLDELGLVRPVDMPPFRIASTLEYRIENSDGSTWGFELDLLTGEEEVMARADTDGLPDQEDCAARVML